MADRKYYCFCDSNCKFETMSKEQILTAIAQAVSEGTVGDIDTGFVTTIKTIGGTPLKFFVGSQAEYEALTEEEKQGLFAIISNDTTISGLQSAVEELLAFKESADEGELNANYANYAKRAMPADAHTEDGDEDGQVFDFSNTSGFGLAGDKSKGHFKLWSVKNSRDEFVCGLVPSKNLSMMLGCSDRVFDRIYAKEIINENGHKIGDKEQIYTAYTPYLYLTIPKDGSVGSVDLVNDLSAKFLTVEVVAITADIYGAQELGRFRTLPFNSNTVEYGGVTIPCKYTLTLGEIVIDFWVTNGTTLNYQMTKGAGGETANTYKITAVYADF